jgi:hypothetical protein
MPRQKWPARWCGRLGGALRYLFYLNILIYYLLEPTIRLLVELLNFVNKNIIIRVWL